jgi:pyridoxal phosphate enzyme (YggS family)
VSLQAVQARVDAAAVRSGRVGSDITVVAVSKGHDERAIMEVYEQGHRDFGENRAQELVVKAAALPTDIRWHFIGPLQRNKVRLVRPTTVLLHSLDRRSLAAAWLKGPGQAPPALIQVNIGREPQKAGVAPEGTADLLTEAVGLGLRIDGVMAIPPHFAEPELVRPFFRELVQMRDDLASDETPLPIVSIGMTEDFEIAIEEGSTTIRVGRAIFGPRPE